MDEQQALLGRTSRPPMFTGGSSVAEAHKTTSGSAGYRDASYNVGTGSSSESESSWEDYHSTCSSCSSSSHSSEEDWEESVADNGELMFIEPAKVCASRSIQEEKETVAPLSAEGIPPAKSILDKQGKFVRWIRRRESKRLRPRLTAVGASLKGDRSTVVTVNVQLTNTGTSGAAALGLDLAEVNNKFVIKTIHFDGPLGDCTKISAGDMLKTINGDDVSMETLEKLNGFKVPCQVTLRFQKAKETPAKNGGCDSKLLQTVVEGDPTLQSKLCNVPCSLVVINIGELPDDATDSDLVFCYPSQSHLLTARGAFVTLNHLLPSVVGSDCKSCTCEVDNESVHVVFYKEDNLLLLLGIPDRICRSEEAVLLTADLVTCLSFSHQTLQCCFRKDKVMIEKFFSGFFSRVLLPTAVPDIPLGAIDPVQHHFHEFLAEATWVPLPKEAQLQLDDALNEIEACDLAVSSGDSMESSRQFIILGSCLYHQGFLLASHLSKHDLMDVHSCLRVNGILDLSRKDGVTRMVIWREVFPSSVNRGLPPTALTPTAYTPPVGRWFLLVVSTGHDMLVAVLENAGCCVPLSSTPSPNVHLVREAEDTLAHVQSLGLTNLAAQWLSMQNRPATTSSRPLPKGTLPRLPAAPVPRPTHGQEDTFSQAPSNLSNPSNASNASESDENAPILGRRAERSGLAFTTAPAAMAAVRELSDDSQSDSSDSDSDWGSFKGLGMNDNGTGLFDNPYMPSNVGDLGEITPAKITSGSDNQLFHLVCVDGNEGVVVTTELSGKPPVGLMAKFTMAAHKIHTQLQHNVRFRAVADPRGVANKSLSVVKECGILIESEDGEKPHWVVGRLFFTPKPREVYVCYSDDAPQNMLEMAFRLGLGMAG